MSRNPLRFRLFLFGGTISKKKTETTSNQNQTSTQANSYGWQTAPETSQMHELQNISDSIRGQVDPSIRATYAGARQNLNDSFQNPLGAYTTQAVRDATLRSGNANLSQQEAGALQGADFQAGQNDFNRQQAITQMTNPVLTQTGGTSTGAMSGTSNTVQSGGLLESLLMGGMSAGGQVGAAAM